MALVLKDRVKETTSTAGTGSVTLLGAVQGYQGFSAIGDGNTTYYTIAGVAEWEVGVGTYSAGVLSRDTVLSSSAGGAKVGFSSGVKDVFVTYAADKAISTDTFSVTGAISTASPNASVNVASLTAAITTANGDLALVSKGTGALLGDIPTNTIAGGNKRGIYAVDWQQVRFLATEVASGAYSGVLSGEDNKASGTGAVVSGGYSNYATDTYTTIAGGGFNSASNDFSAVVGGYNNVASGTYSIASGGQSNLASNNYSSITGGQSNSATGLHTVIAGGSNNLASGNSSAVIAGQYGTTRGIVGYLVTPASQSPIEAKAGVQQAGCLIVGCQTTNATATKLRSDSNAAGAANQLILQNNSAVMFFFDLVGWDQTDYITINCINGLIVRGANAASTVLKSPGYHNYEKSAGATTWLMAVSADTTNGGLIITVTGQASKTIRWVAKIFTTEVAF